MLTISFPLNWWFAALKNYAGFCSSYFVSLETSLTLIQIKRYLWWPEIASLSKHWFLVILKCLISYKSWFQRLLLNHLSESTKSNSLYCLFLHVLSQWDIKKCFLRVMNPFWKWVTERWLRQKKKCYLKKKSFMQIKCCQYYIINSYTSLILIWLFWNTSYISWLLLTLR